MKVKYIVMKMIDCRSLSLDTLVNLKPGTYEFMKKVMDSSHDGKFIAGDSKDKLCKDLNISGTTFWKKIRELESAAMMKKSSRGIYNLNKLWLKVFTFDSGENTKELLFKI